MVESSWDSMLSTLKLLLEARYVCIFIYIFIFLCIHLYFNLNVEKDSGRCKEKNWKIHGI